TPTSRARATRSHSGAVCVAVTRTSSLFVDRATTFLIFSPLPQEQDISLYPDATRSISAHTSKIDLFSNSGTSRNSRTSRRRFNGAPGRHAARHHGPSVAAQRLRVCQVQAQTSKFVPAERSAILRARGNGQHPLASPHRACLRPRWHRFVDAPHRRKCSQFHRRSEISRLRVPCCYQARPHLQDYGNLQTACCAPRQRPWCN